MALSGPECTLLTLWRIKKQNILRSYIAKYRFWCMYFPLGVIDFSLIGALLATKIILRGPRSATSLFEIFVFDY